MSGEQANTDLPINEKRPADHFEIAMWCYDGSMHKFPCPTCIADANQCWGCPVAWREIDGQKQYWRRPVHDFPVT